MNSYYFFLLFCGLGALIVYLLVKETPEEKSLRLEKEEAQRQNFLKLLDGTFVKILDEKYPAPEFYGIITKKIVFNSWECDHALIYFKVDVYNKNKEKVDKKEYYDTQLVASV